MLTIDFETRSCCDLTDTSVWVYAEHHTTEVLCLALKEDEAPAKWTAGESFAIKALGHASSIGDLDFVDRFVPMGDIPSFLNRHDIIEAHNAEFEVALWHHILHKRQGFPDLPIEKMRCSAAKAAMHALPRSLGGLCDALELEIRKDKEGNALMRKMAIPRNPTKEDYLRIEGPFGLPYKEAKAKHAWKAMRSRWYEGQGDDAYIMYIEDPESCYRLIKYCIRDVDSEQAASTRLKDLPPYELAIWRLDQKINRRRVPVSTSDAEALQGVIDYSNEKSLKELYSLTEGKVESTGGKAIKEWLERNGCGLPNMQAATIAKALESPSLPKKTRRVLQIKQQLSKSSVSKLPAFIKCTSKDGRARSTLMYHGASTGRWTAKGIQLQNVPRGDLKPSEVEEVIRLARLRVYGVLEMLQSGLHNAVSSCLRGMLKAPEGKEFICSDFSAIEGRALAWLAGEQHVLQNYIDGKCPYCATAAMCFGVPYEEIWEGYKNGIQKYFDLRYKGKGGELGAGYGGSYRAVLNFAPKLSPVEGHEIVTNWRDARPKTKKMWYDLRDAMAKAMEAPGEVIPCGKVHFKYRKEYGFLMVRLPSGRLLYYPFPELVVRESGFGIEARKALEAPNNLTMFGRYQFFSKTGNTGEYKDSITGKVRTYSRGDIGKKPLTSWEDKCVSAMVIDATTKKWVRRDITVPIITENITQAVARDLMAESMLRLESSEYPVVLSVHDEVIGEVDEGSGSVEEFEELMETRPEWAEDFPLAAAGGWRGKRYKK
jgi:DNA polymerase